MNTPLGNVSMSVSYIEHMIEKMKDEDKALLSSDILQVFTESMKVVAVETAELSEIVRGLQLLTVKIEDRSLEITVLKDILMLSLSDFNGAYHVGEGLNLEIIDQQMNI